MIIISSSQSRRWLIKYIGGECMDYKLERMEIICDMELKCHLDADNFHI